MRERHAQKGCRAGPPLSPHDHERKQLFQRRVSTRRVHDGSDDSSYVRQRICRKVEAQQHIQCDGALLHRHAQRCQPKEHVMDCALAASFE